ncbi:MAG: ABC transporter permease subunit [Leptospiraceae bacterium]|nr:ABC transporter permease subunit [Leptospiraceae bacterium]
MKKTKFVRYWPAFILLAAFILSFIVPAPVINLGKAWCLPSLTQNPLGCSPLGQDLALLILSSLKETLLIAIAGRCFALLLSVLGFFAAWQGGQFIESSLLRLSDALLTLPALLLALAAGFILGSGRISMILAIAVSEWAVNQKWLIGRLREYSRATYIEAARSGGAGKFFIMVKHFSPPLREDVGLLFFLFFPGSLLNVTALEFLGLTASERLDGLGYLIAAYRDAIFLYPHVVLFPAVSLVLVILLAVLAKDVLQKKKYSS